MRRLITFLNYTVKIPPRVMFITQVWGTIIGCIVNYVVMVSIVTSKRDVLLDPQGTNAWSGQTVQVSPCPSKFTTVAKLRAND
jgi:hypothetical protein